MKMNAKTIIAASIAVMMIASVFFVFGGGEGADDDDTVLGASATVDITGKAVSTIQRDIQTAIGEASAGETVTVIGDKTDADNVLELDIPADVTVIWKAVYTNDPYTDLGPSVIGYGGDGIYLTGSGTFEVAAGATISFEGNETILTLYDAVYLIISGGEVINTNYGDAIHIGIGGILVAGGLVRSNSDEGGATIYAAGESGIDVTVTGGTVEAVGGSAVAIMSNGPVNISGGTVKASGEGSQAIYANNCGVAITGGLVQATGTDAYAIFMEAGAAAYLAGTVKGDLGVWEDGMGSAIFEVSTLNIPADWDGTNNGVTLIMGEAYTLDDVSWAVGDDVYLNIGRAYSFLWEGDGVPSDGGSPSLWVGVVIGAIAALLIIIVALLLRTKS